MREATKRIVSAIEQIGGDRRKQIKGLWRRKFPALKSEGINNNLHTVIGYKSYFFDMKFLYS